jgi:hypothetical protein
MGSHGRKCGHPRFLSVTLKFIFILDRMESISIFSGSGLKE